MSRLVGPAVIALALAGCAPVPSAKPVSSAVPTATAVPSPAAAPASLVITGSGTLCGPWWMGCGAVLVLEQPGWKLPADWTPSAKDAVFAVDLRVGTDEATRVTGVAAPGRDRIEPGTYLLAGIMTRKPDSPADAPLESSVGCSTELEVPIGTRSVTVDVTFRTACRIEVSMRGSTPG